MNHNRWQSAKYEYLHINNTITLNNYARIVGHGYVNGNRIIFLFRGKVVDVYLMSFAMDHTCS